MFVLALVPSLDNSFELRQKRQLMFICRSSYARREAENNHLEEKFK